MFLFQYFVFHAVPYLSFLPNHILSGCKIWSQIGESTLFSVKIFTHFGFVYPKNKFQHLLDPFFNFELFQFFFWELYISVSLLGIILLTSVSLVGKIFTSVSHIEKMLISVSFHWENTTLYVQYILSGVAAIGKQNSWIDITYYYFLL